MIDLSQATYYHVSNTPLSSETFLLRGNVKEGLILPSTRDTDSIALEGRPSDCLEIPGTISRIASIGFGGE